MRKTPRPFRGHQFHKQSNDALLNIILDAREAERNMRELGNTIAEQKYCEQVIAATAIWDWRYINNVKVAI